MTDGFAFVNIHAPKYGTLQGFVIKIQQICSKSLYWIWIIRR